MRISFNNCGDVAFGHDQYFFVVDLFSLHAVAIVENHDVTNFNVQRLHGPVFRMRPLPTAMISPRVDLAAATGQNDAARRFGFNFFTFDDRTIMLTDEYSLIALLRESHYQLWVTPNAVYRLVQRERWGWPFPASRAKLKKIFTFALAHKKHARQSVIRKSDCDTLFFTGAGLNHEWF